MKGRRLRPKLTYANVMSTVAAFLALTGGATAIAMSSLPKNSVKSKQIAKNAVTGPKIAKEAVTEAKIGKEAVTGPKVKVSTLPKVPSAVKADTAGTAATATNATHADTAGHADSAGTADTATTASSLGSIPASAVAKEQTVSSGEFTSTLTDSVSGYGSFSLVCHQNNVGNDNDDTLGYFYSAGPLVGALETGLITAQEFPLSTPDIFTVSETIEGASSEYGTQGRILHVQWEATVIGTNKTIVIEGGGYDAPGPGCGGQLHAYTTS